MRNRHPTVKHTTTLSYPTHNIKSSTVKHPTDDRPPRPRSYEEAGLEAAPPSARAKAQDRVRALWHRQLAVPLAGGEGAMERYEAWEAAAGGVGFGGGVFGGRDRAVEKRRLGGLAWGEGGVVPLRGKA